MCKGGKNKKITSYKTDKADSENQNTTQYIPAEKLPEAYFKKNRIMSDLHRRLDSVAYNFSLLNAGSEVFFVCSLFNF